MGQYGTRLLPKIGFAFLTDPDGFVHTNSYQLVLMGQLAGQLFEARQDQAAVEELEQLDRGCSQGQHCLDSVFAMFAGVVSQMQVRCSTENSQLSDNPGPEVTANWHCVAV